MRLFRKKAPAPPGLKLLSDVSDEDILGDIDRLYSTIIPAMDQLIRGSAVFLASIQRPEGLSNGERNEVWEEMRLDILDEVRSLDQHAVKKGGRSGSDVAELFALYYHAFMWGNTLNTVPQWQECMERGRTMLPNDIAPSEMKRGYDARKDRGYS